MIYSVSEALYTYNGGVFDWPRVSYVIYRVFVSAGSSDHWFAGAARNLNNLRCTELKLIEAVGW